MSSGERLSAKIVVIKFKKEFTWHSWQLPVFRQGPFFLTKVRPKLFCSDEKKTGGQNGLFDTLGHEAKKRKKKKAPARLHVLIGLFDLMCGADVFSAYPTERGTHRALWQRHLFSQIPQRFEPHTRTGPHRLSSPFRWWESRFLLPWPLQHTSFEVIVAF